MIIEFTSSRSRLLRGNRQSRLSPSLSPLRRANFTSRMPLRSGSGKEPACLPARRGQDHVYRDRYYS